MGRTKTYPWDPAEHLDSEEERIAYLDAALEEDDPLLVAAVLDDIARSKGMEKVAADAGLASAGSDSTPTGSPEFSTVLRVVRALGLRLRAEPATAGQSTLDTS